jgi:DNA-binding IclR family transcriptional regulator
VPVPASASSAVDKALALLEQVAGAPEALRLSEVAGRVELHRATAYRVLADLVERGWVTRVGERYLPGPVLVRVSASAAGRSLAGLCRPVLEELSAGTGMMVNLQVLTPDRSRVVDVVRPEHLAMISDLRDELLPVHRFAGPLALVAALDEAGRAPYLRVAEADGVELGGAQGLRAALDRAAADGFAVQRGRAERVVGSVSRAVAVGGPGGGGVPVCALTLVGPVAEFDDARLGVLRGALAGACERLAGEVLRGAGVGAVRGEDAR